jgi:hypothetical protein
MAVVGVPAVITPTLLVMLVVVPTLIDPENPVQAPGQVAGVKESAIAGTITPIKAVPVTEAKSALRIRILRVVLHIVMLSKLMQSTCQLGNPAVFNSLAMRRRPIVNDL